SRMLGGDLETTTQRECDDLAKEIHAKVVHRIALAANDVSERMAAPPRTVIASGTGEFLIRGVLASVLFKAAAKTAPVISLRTQMGDAGSAAACAAAVAILCQERLQA